MDQKLINEIDPKQREDRIGIYLQDELEGVVFAGLSDGVLEQLGLTALSGIEVPIKAEHIVEYSEESGLGMAELARTMIFITGCDPLFKYALEYVYAVKKLYGDDFIKAILNEALEATRQEDYKRACIWFRGALCVDPSCREALYGYAGACRELYKEDPDDTERTGRFKAESMKYLEYTVAAYPEMDMPYYFLGYAYLNMGLYIKARLVWKRFLELAEESEYTSEIRGRCDELKEPAAIEQAQVHIMAGRFAEGVSALEPYVGGKYEKWWPLHYYLGIGYKNLGRWDLALEAFHRVLRLNGSHLESMNELVDIYRDLGDTEMADKYARKILLVESNLREDMQG